MNESRTTAVRYLFTGRVQGVGFRWTTKRIAANYPVTGYVKNLSDGRVELVVSGDEADVAAFLQDLRQRMAANVDAVDEQIWNSDEIFEDFTIRR